MQQLQKLTETVDDLSTQARQIRAELHKRTRVFIAFVGIGTVLLVAAVSAAFIVSLDNKQAIEENNRRWCPVVEPLVPHQGDPPPSGTPAQIERSVRIRNAFAQLARDFGCTP